MIVSHRYGFIFIKTGKVGGTSLELALAPLLGPDDVITPVSPPDELARARAGGRTCQNFAKKAGELRPSEWPKWLRHRGAMALASGDRQILEKRRLPKKYWNHMDAGSIRRRVGSATWDTYYKITVERNPWDKLVSRYFWESVKNEEGLSFTQFVCSGRPLKSDFERYSINGIVAADEILRYETLYADLTQLSHTLGLPEDLGEQMRDISAKRGYRPGANATSFYDDWSRQAVDIFFAREIRLMGYEFPQCHSESSA